MAAIDVTSILRNAQSPDAALRNQAELQLQSYQTQNLSGYFLSLATELADEQKPGDIRQIAGLIIKNALDAPSEARKEQIARHTAALALAKVAAIELPLKQWQNLISTLLANMGQQPPNPTLKQATLESLGYICEEMAKIPQDVLEQEQVNSILTAVHQGMHKDEPDVHVRRAATNALYNALEFAQTNFENKGERDVLMMAICEGTAAPDEEVRKESFQCLVKVAAGYYDKLPSYMEIIFGLTQRAVQEDVEDVAKQAIEFWCTVAEEEIDLQEEQEEGDSNVINHHFVKQALQPLLKLLLQQLLKQEEDQDKDDTLWNVSMAAGTCIGLIAATVGDDIIPDVMAFVQTNIAAAGPEHWRQREAATFALGSILEGPTIPSLSPLVAAGLEFLLTAMRDPNSQVRHTTAWTIGRILEFVHGPYANPPVVNAANLPKVKQVLLDSVSDQPHIAEKVCYAISQLAVGFKDQDTSPLSSSCQEIIQALLNTAERANTGDTEALRLQTQAFEAINEVVRSSAVDTLPLISQLIPLVISKLRTASVAGPVGGEARERQTELQGLLCGVLQVIVQRLSDVESMKPAVVGMADAIMEALLTVFACRNATVHEEALLAAGSLTYATGKGFAKYMEAFYPVLEMGLTNYQEWQVCSAAVGVLGDVCRAIEDAIVPYCDRVMRILLQNLESNDVQRSIKPQILSAFGDVALAIGDRFGVYVPHVIVMLQSAQMLSVQQQQTGDEDLMEYNNLLRMGIFEAYSGILNGMSSQMVNGLVTRCAQPILDFIEWVWSDQENAEPQVMRAAISLLGDLATAVPSCGLLFTTKPYVQQMMHMGRASSDADLAKSAEWAWVAIVRAMASCGAAPQAAN